MHLLGYLLCLHYCIKTELSWIYMDSMSYEFVNLNLIEVAETHKWRGGLLSNQMREGGIWFWQKQRLKEWKSQCDLSSLMFNIWQLYYHINERTVHKSCVTSCVPFSIYLSLVSLLSVNILQQVLQPEFLSSLSQHIISGNCFETLKQVNIKH